MKMKIDIREEAGRIEERAYDMFPRKHKPSEYAEDPFPMYSYERVATQFWHGFISKLLEEGMDEKTIESLLRHKLMRWMLDSGCLEDFGREMAEEYKGYKIEE